MGGNREDIRKRVGEKRERDLRLGRERMRRRRLLLKSKGEEGKRNAGREHLLQVFHPWEFTRIEGGRC